MKKKVLTSITGLVMAVALSFAVAAMPVDAASVNVTKKMSTDKNLKRITKMVAAYTTAMNLSANASDTQTTVKLNNQNKLSIAAFVRYYYKDDYGYTAKELKNETKNLFGKQASTKVIGSSDNNNLLVCSADQTFVREAYMYCGGDFGDCIPGYKIKKITQLKKNVYQIEIKNKYSVYGEKGSTSAGTTILKVKKSAKSSYGYIIKSIQYSR
ncbi:MAG: hypothetical protein LUF92_14140 [Clostridiales bacterium]|nr:hypothetical protein [Clostridiales bacterium]